MLVKLVLRSVMVCLRWRQIEDRRHGRRHGRNLAYNMGWGVGGKVDRGVLGILICDRVKLE